MIKENIARTEDILMKLDGINDLLACVAIDDPAIFVLQTNLNECVEGLYGIVEHEKQTSCAS